MTDIVKSWHLGACQPSGDQFPAGDGCLEDCPRRLHAEVDQLRDRVQVLETYLDDRLLLRIAAERGWDHEPDNALGNWCCDKHQKAWRNGTLYRNG